MHLTNILLKAYRSFNYDFRLKAMTDPEAMVNAASLWEDATNYEEWSPWIDVSISSPISTIVGLNESGKSHLINAISKMCTLEDLREDDICRYSTEGQLGEVGSAKLGARWTDLSDSFCAAFNDLFRKTDPEDKPTNDRSESNPDSVTSNEMDSCSLYVEKDDSILLIKTGEPRYALHVFDSNNVHRFHETIDRETLGYLLDAIPRPVHVDPRISLPTKVSFKALCRAAELDISEKKEKEAFVEAVHSSIGVAKYNWSDTRVTPSENLVYRLLRECVGLNPKALARIVRVKDAPTKDALLKDWSSQATSGLGSFLNLSSWWAQDVDTSIGVSFQNDEVVFTVTDRTSSWYGFAERSTGMRRFLAYMVQILLELARDNQPLIIVSDEPDFALSYVGQHDLMRFFRKVVDQERDGGKSQLVFTTHSSELIDPNRPDRITVLRKGLFDEGTLVVSPTHHSLFEPVRSALGGEGYSLPFIDGPNLVVEGCTDRVFLDRMTRLLAKMGERHVDLSYLTIVVANGCPRMPAIVKTATSLMGDRAYLTVLLDSDETGLACGKELGKIDPYLHQHDQIVYVSCVFERGSGKEAELEDIVPPELYLEALKVHFAENKKAITSLSKTTPAQFRKMSLTAGVVASAEDLLTRADVLLSPHKPDIVNQVFDLHESNRVAEKISKLFLQRIRTLTENIVSRVNANIRNKRHNEVRRTMDRITGRFFLTYSIDIPKDAARILLGQLQELGNRVAPVGAFDMIIETIMKKHELRRGLSHDSILDPASFVVDVKQLQKDLTIDLTQDVM